MSALHEYSVLKGACPMKPAVFLDRDGVLTRERGYAISSIDEMEIFPYTALSINKIKEKGYLTIVVTNQSGVAKGLFTEDELVEMNNRLMDEIKADALYYCPHHPNGIVTRYSKKCSCRKPAIGMIQQAAKDFEIDLKRSFVVGDRACDILLGQNAGIRTILLNSGYGEDKLEEPCNPDYIFKDLRDVIEIL